MKNNIKQYRISAGMSQMDLAIEVQTSPAAICGYEKGLGLRDETAYRIALALGEPATLVFPGKEFGE